MGSEGTGSVIDLVRKIEREATRSLSDDGCHSINLSLSLKYCRDIAREILKSGETR